MIVDSTVLISLGNLGKIELINNCIIPENILKEITNELAKSALLTLKFQKVIPLKNSIKRSLKILGDKYETGDSDIVALLIDSPLSIIATGDRRLRNVSRALGVKVIGTLGILINSVKTRKISKEKALVIFIKPILDILKKEVQNKIKKEISDNPTIRIDEKIIDLKTMAKGLNISCQTLEQIPIPDYFIVGTKLVSKEFLDELREEIGEKRKIAEIKKVLDKYELTDRLLDLIGYKIVWNGLIPTKIIEKGEKN